MVNGNSDVFVLPAASHSLWRLNEDHCHQFLLRSKVEDGWQGWVPHHWAFSVTGESDWTLPHKSLTYTALKELASPDSGIQDAAVFLAVMAWSGMNAKHGRSSWRHIEVYSDIISELREATISPFEAYNEFSDLVGTLARPGMGPAFFTPLIHFCSQTSHSYIMDQRTGRSMNLLFEPTRGKKMAVAFNGDCVSPRNSGKTYVQFCSLIDLLAELIGNTDGLTISRRLSGTGNRARGTPDAWSQYVIDQRGPPGKLPHSVLSTGQIKSASEKPTPDFVLAHLNSILKQL